MKKDNNRRPGSKGEGRIDSKKTTGKFGPKKDFFDKREGKKTEFSKDSNSEKKGYNKEKGYEKSKGFDKPAYGNKSRYSKDDQYQGTQKPYNSRSDEKRTEGEFKKVYRGRGKDEKPVHEWVPSDKFSKDTRYPKKNFKKPFVKNNNEDRPEYNFEKLEQNHKKKNKSEEIRLNKYISNSGICSRREADELIQNGSITVNGQVIKEMGYKVKPGERVSYKGKPINPEKPVYLLLNKPKDFITTTEDPMERKTVMNLIANACEERVFPVGRLDRNTTGLLLFTNDGELAAKLSHPSNNIKKIYQVTLDKPLTQNDEKTILEGLQLEDGLAQVDDMQVLSKDRTILGLEIHLGRNRIVRRIFAQLGYEVVGLDRVMYAGLDKKDLSRGNYRFLTEKEVIRLKFFL
ncbi:pseudouridine synthase [Cecembia rubra]|uniref:Pseudouridine synthase n=1 Tax=Cecembia rubra TaxID=1485585 RepID=A0A2P8E4L0_9BACT|nr:pseudouridine synthase [Cecembia rubra]PSL04404.1 23S rRNA pseudouridine2605 synthase [Cecembia rubra]